MTADRMSVSLDRFLRIEPERIIIRYSYSQEWDFDDNNICIHEDLSGKLPIRPRMTGNLSPSCLTFPWTSPNRALCDPNTALVDWAWLITSSICRRLIKIIDGEYLTEPVYNYASHGQTNTRTWMYKHYHELHLWGKMIKTSLQYSWINSFLKIYSWLVVKSFIKFHTGY